jgi:hypothetical protein
MECDGSLRVFTVIGAVSALLVAESRIGTRDRSRRPNVGRPQVGISETAKAMFGNELGAVTEMPIEPLSQWPATRPTSCGPNVAAKSVGGFGKAARPWRGHLLFLFRASR